MIVFAVQMDCIYDSLCSSNSSDSPSQCKFNRRPFYKSISNIEYKTSEFI